ncbi:MAG: phosphomannomutase/phosphoglucomutase [Pontibacterium sp.]
MGTQFTLPPREFEPSIFRAYDIRGIVDKTLNDDTVYAIGRAFAAQCLADQISQVTLAADGRLSSPVYKRILAQGLVDGGMQVTDIGFAATPILYFAVVNSDSQTGIMITGSHNPVDYNGFKLMIAGDTLANDEIQALKQRIETNKLPAVAGGSVTQADPRPSYHNYIRNDIQLARPMKVVIDCGNGIPGEDAPALFTALGCEVTAMYCEVDGSFPNHHPDPSKPKNLIDATSKVKALGADLGLAFDGDGDRVGLITPKGQLVDTDRLMLLLSDDLLSRHPGAEVIYDVKCSRILPQRIESQGGIATMWKTGHSLMKRKMRSSAALIGGEMSGHIYFKERWFGFDDGLYAAARLLEILSQHKQSADELFDSYPRDLATPELNIAVSEQEKFAIVDALSKHDFGSGQVSRVDGIRVDYDNSWGLVRASNTTPVLVLRFEGKTAQDLHQVKQIFAQALYAIDPQLHIPEE